jgi:hypothetical protein
MDIHRFGKQANNPSQPRGLTLDCACVHCDYYQDGILFGPGGREHYFFPAFHTVKKKIVSLNIYRYLKIEEYKSPERENPELARFRAQHTFPYFERGMFKAKTFEVGFRSDLPRLQWKSNYCPQCGKMGLQFCIDDHFD